MQGPVDHLGQAGGTKGWPVFRRRPKDASVRQGVDLVQDRHAQRHGGAPHDRRVLDRLPGAYFEAVQRPGADAVITGHDGRFATLFGAPENARLPRNTALERIVRSDDHSAMLSLCESRAKASDGAIFELQREFRVRRAKAGDGDDVWLLLVAQVRTKADGMRAWTGFVVDATARREDERRIYHLAYYDPLTNLPNRRLFMERLRAALEGRPRKERFGAVAFLDLDNFKTLNDTRGHAAGDVLLETVAERLLSCVPENATVARLGGDEFVLLIEAIDWDRARATERMHGLANLVLRTIDQPVPLGGGDTHRVTSSVGLVVFEHGNSDADRVLQEADTAMYAAKEAGKNKCRAFDGSLRERLEASGDLLSDLRHALENDLLHPVFQAKVDRDGRIASAEMLARWRHPTRGLVSPGEFVPLAERSGLIGELNQWVIRKGAETLLHWASLPHAAALELSVNVSAHQFVRGTFREEIERHLPSRALRERLVLELTERVMGEDDEVVRETMHEVKAAGVKLALDDFGTGYSSFSLLKNLPVDELKIDGSFVAELDRKPEDRAIVQAILAMARTLGMTTVAEMVETEPQRALLHEDGCDLFQGFLYGPPVRLDVFDQLAGLPLARSARSEPRAGRMAGAA